MTTSFRLFFVLTATLSFGCSSPPTVSKWYHDSLIRATSQELRDQKMDLELARAQALDARQAQAIAELERDRTLAVDQILELHTEAEDIRKALENWTHDGALTKAMRERLAEIRARIAHHDKLIEQKADQSTLDALARDMDERVAGTEETIDQVKRAAGETLEELREIRHFESRERVEN